MSSRERAEREYKKMKIQLDQKTKIRIEQQIILSFTDEYVNAVKAKERNIGTPFEIAHNATMRMLGITYFAQALGIEYDFLESIYNDYKKRIETTIL
jgi:hypothetical protein